MRYALLTEETLKVNPPAKPLKTLLMNILRKDELIPDWRKI